MADKTEQKEQAAQAPGKHGKLGQAKMSPLLKISLILLLIVLLVVILYYGKALLMPLAIAAILAMMLNPLMNRLSKIGLPKWLTIIALTIMLILILGVVLLVIGKQIGTISQDWPEIHQKLLATFNAAERYIQETFHIKPAVQESSVVHALPIKDILMTLLGSLQKIVANGLLVLVYMILMLTVRTHFKALILNLAKPEYKSTANQAIEDCIKICSKFLFGRSLIVLILIGIYTLGFWLGGVSYFFFLALIAGLLSIIPILGNIIGGGIACILALVTGGPVSLLIVLCVIIIGQMIGDYVLTPWILGDVIKLNPFMVIVSVIAFTLLWGPVGAIISLPIVAILRILLQNMEATKEYAKFLVGGK